jgi:argininosuccinate lyase
MSSFFRSRLDSEFSDATARFHTSVDEDLRMFEEDILGTQAHDIMLHEQGIIPEEDLREILKALENLRRLWRTGNLVVGSGFEDIHEFIESRVVEETGIRTGGMIHTGRSRNDQVMVDMKMVTRRDLLSIGDRLSKLIGILLKRAGENLETIMILYTHGQHAQVGSLAHYLMNYVEAFSRDLERLIQCFRRVNLNPLGGGPIGGTSIAIDRSRTTQLLGFSGLQENSINATSGRAWAIETASVCAILMGNLSRATADLIEWSKSEFGYIEIADEYASSSSIMPQKKNPSTLELIRGKTGKVYGDLIHLITMVKGLPTGYYQDLQQTKLALWNLLDTTMTSLEVFTGIIGTFRVDRERMLDAVKESYVYAVEIAEILVQEKGLSFREAYRITAYLVNKQLQENKKLGDIKPKDVLEASKEVIDREVIVDEHLIREATGPKLVLKRRTSMGSPNPGILKEAIKDGASENERRSEIIEAEKRSIDDALEKLQEIVISYVKT